MTNSEILGIKMDRVWRAIKDGEERMREKEVSTMMPKFTNRTDSGHIH